jgi:hypothetical protein
MEQPTALVPVLKHDGGKRFADMTRTQKWIFVAKVIACVGTFGYAFPNVQND